MAIDRFTRFGLAVAILGWVVLAADVALTPLLEQAGRLATVTALRGDVFVVAEATIFSGFALAIIGVLRAGFGALHRFFDAVLERASMPRHAPVTAGTAPAVAVDPVIEPVVDRPAERSATPSRPAARKNYTILANGAVEVETLLGTRVFASLHEAKDYIR